MNTLDDALKRLMTAPVDRSSPLPIYVQIAASLRSLIQAGTLPAGSTLPPEKMLCDAFDVSRTTLRQAYDVLGRADLIQSQRGRGTLVVPPRLRKEQQQMRSFTEEIRARGGTPRSKLLGFEIADPSPASQQSLRLPAGQQVYRIERVRFDGATPLAIEKAEVPCFLCPRLERFDFAAQSLYQVLESEFHVRLDHCVETISAGISNRRQRQLLELPRGTAILQIERMTYTDNNTPVELAVTTYRADMFRTVVHSVRPKTPNLDLNWKSERAR